MWLRFRYDVLHVNSGSYNSLDLVFKLLLPLPCIKVGSTNQISERSHMITVKTQLRKCIEPSQSRPSHFNSDRHIALV